MWSFENAYLLWQLKPILPIELVKHIWRILLLLLRVILISSQYSNNERQHQLLSHTIVKVGSNRNQILGFSCPAFKGRYTSTSILVVSQVPRPTWECQSGNQTISRLPVKLVVYKQQQLCTNYMEIASQCYFSPLSQTTPFLHELIRLIRLCATEEGAVAYFTSKNLTIGSGGWIFSIDTTSWQWDQICHSKHFFQSFQFLFSTCIALQIHSNALNSRWICLNSLNIYVFEYCSSERHVLIRLCLA